MENDMQLSREIVEQAVQWEIGNGIAMLSHLMKIESGDVAAHYWTGGRSEELCGNVYEALEATALPTVLTDAVQESEIGQNERLPSSVEYGEIAPVSEAFVSKIEAKFGVVFPADVRERLASQAEEAFWRYVQCEAIYEGDENDLEEDAASAGPGGP